MSGWKTLSTRIVYENPYAYIEESEVINPGGQKTVYGVIKSKVDGVYIVPVDESGNTYLTQQYRYPIKQLSWELPAGRVDEGDFLTAAKRELREETGIQAQKYTELGTINPANGIAAFDEKIFLAEDLTDNHNELDPVDGILARKKLPIDDAIVMVMEGNINCPQTATALFMAREFIQRRKYGSTNN